MPTTAIESKVTLMGPQPAGISLLGNIADTAALIAIETSQLAKGSVATLVDGSQYFFDPTLSSGGLVPTSGGGRWFLLAGSGQAVNVKTFGATGDGSTDDTAAIQAAVTAVSAVNGSLFFPAGRYIITAAINITAAIRIYGEGYSSRLSITTAANGLAISASYVTIEYLRLDGATSRMISVAGSNLTNLVVRFCDISGATVAPVILNAAGIYCDGVSDSLIENNSLHDNGLVASPCGSDILFNHGVSTVSTNVTIRNNKIVSLHTSVGICCFMSSLFKIHGNEVSTVHQDGVTNSGYGILIYSKDATRLVKNTVIGNTVHDCLGSGIYFVNVDDSVISDNVCINNATTQTDASLPVGGISINDGNNNSITGNTVHTSGKDGIVIVGTLTAISGNQVSNTAQHGIRVRGGIGYVTITGNQISSITGKGFFTDAALTGITITGNTFKSITSWCIYFVNGSSCIVSGNQINIAGSGILFLLGSLNSITGNVINGGGSGAAGVAIEVLGTDSLIADNRGDSFSYGLDEEGTGNICRNNYFTNCPNERTDSSPVVITSGATPDVNKGDVFNLTYGGATNVTNFLKGVINEKKTFRATNGNATIKNGATILLNGGVDFVMAANNVLVLQKVSATEWIELSRKV